MTLPPLRLTAAERMYLAAELDQAADGYVDAAQREGSAPDAEMMADARRLRRFAERMRGGTRPRLDGEMVRLADIPPSSDAESLLRHGGMYGSGGGFGWGR